MAGNKMDALRDWVLRARGTSQRRDPAEQILRERFARGEVGAEEYEHGLGLLRSSGDGGESRGTKARLLAAGLVAAVLLSVVVGVGLAGVRSGAAEGDGAKEESGSMMDRGSGSMMSMMMGGGTMSGDRMDSMMGGDMGSMMGNGQMMGSFDEEEPFDLQFIDQMSVHHEGAIMSAEHMISDSKRPELRKLAASIEESQSEQIEQMQDFREEWYPDATQTSGMPAGEMEEMMGGESMEQMMGGDTTDEMFLEMMIPHHQMAVDMSEKALTQAEHPQLKELAQEIKAEQTAEIELMKGYLQEIENTTNG